MKYILLFLLCGAVNSLLDPSEYGPKLKKLAKTLHDTCVERSKLQPETYQELRQLKFPDKDEAKKYFSCLCFESTLLDENLKLNEELLLDLVPETIKGFIVGLVKDCFAKTQDDKDNFDKIYSVVKCVYAYDNGDFFMI